MAQRRGHQTTTLMTEAFEDRFIYRVNPLEMNIRGTHAGGNWHISAGPGPGESWKPGAHQVTLHDRSGNRVAEAQWAVTP